MVRAIVIEETGGPEVLKLADVPVGEPGPGQVRIRHKACGLNFIDVYQRTGLYKLDLPHALGMEAAGVVEAVGEGVTHLKPGDRAAYASQPPGAYCEARVMPAAQVCPLPDGISFEEGAAIMLQGMTVEYLFHRTTPIAQGRPRPLPRRRRGRRAAGLPVGEVGRDRTDRHRRVGREMQTGRRSGRGSRHQLQHRGLRRPRQGDHGRQGRRRGHGQRRQGHVRRLARLPEALGLHDLVRQRVRSRAAGEPSDARGQGLAQADDGPRFSLISPTPRPARRWRSISSTRCCRARSRCGSARPFRWRRSPTPTARSRRGRPRGRRS